MLKIKDNDDLKELEKFGFRKETSSLDNIPLGYTLDVCDNEKDDEYSFLYVYPDESYYKRRLLIECNQESSIMDVVFDLIQAGLVEKEKLE